MLTVLHACRFYVITCRSAMGCIALAMDAKVPIRLQDDLPGRTHFKAFWLPDFARTVSALVISSLKLFAPQVYHLFQRKVPFAVAD